jgi:hypothetical protein
MQITPEFLDSLDEWVREYTGPGYRAENVRYSTSKGYWNVIVTNNDIVTTDNSLVGVSLVMSDQEFRKRIAAWTRKHEEDEKKLREHLASAQILSEEETLDRLFEERP